MKTQKHRFPFRWAQKRTGSSWTLKDARYHDKFPLTQRQALLESASNLRVVLLFLYEELYYVELKTDH